MKAVVGNDGPDMGLRFSWIIDWARRALIFKAEEAQGSYSHLRLAAKGQRLW